MSSAADSTGSVREQDWHRLGTLLDRLLDLSPEAARQELDRLEPDDETLRARLTAALAAAHDEAGPFAADAFARWASVLAGEDQPSGASAMPAGSRFGAWEIGEEIGRGGMGTVYAARRADGAYEQRAALKLLAANVDRPETRARFVQERQILARLQHPAIAHLFDGGVAPDGRPWLVIERVDGESITAHADRHRLSVEGRLALFAQVLEAVDYAHRNLVVHRDLKPSNIWVGSGGMVKLLDFGIAKLLAPGGAEEATRVGLALTPQYAAPEQVSGGAITTATDVYSLGVVLYELLSGRKPYLVAGATALVLERAIALAEPAPLVWPVGDPEAATLARLRATSPERLARRLKGDLEAIVGKALAKDPEARYASAGALARDLADHLAGLPIRAHPEPFVRRARKFARRHRLGVAVGLTLVLGLIGILVASRVALIQSRQRLAEAQRAEATENFLQQLFSEIDPESARGRPVTLAEVVDRGAQRLGTELAEQPRTRAALLLTLGQLYQKLARYGEARRLLDEALSLARQEYGPMAPETARALVALGDLAYWSDDFEQAAVHQRAAQRIFERSAGLEAEAASARFNVGVALRQLGRHEEALAEELAALEIERSLHGEDSLQLATVATGVALTLHNLARDEEAITYAERALKIRRQGLPEDHPAIADTLEALGLSRIELGDSAAAANDLAECLSIRRRVYGDDHPEVLEALNDLASAKEAAALFDEALELRREAMTLARRILPAGSDSLAIEINNFAILSFRLGRFADAADGFSAAAAIWSLSAGERSTRVAFARNNLAFALLRLDRPREALAEVEAALSIRRESVGETSAEVAQSLRILGMARLATRDLEGAREALDRCVELSRSVYSERHPRLAEALATRASLWLALGERREGRRDLEEALSIREEKLGADHPLTVETRTALAGIGS